MASIQLRTLVDNVLQDTSRDMREQADAVDVAYKKRVDEVQDAKQKLEENLKKVRFYNCLWCVGVIVTFNQESCDESAIKARFATWLIKCNIPFIVCSAPQNQQLFAFQS